MERSCFENGEDDLQIWVVGMNILNRKWRTADKGWSSTLDVGREANNAPP